MFEFPVTSRLPSSHNTLELTLVIYPPGGIFRDRSTRRMDGHNFFGIPSRRYYLRSCPLHSLVTGVTMLNRKLRSFGSTAACALSLAVALAGFNQSPPPPKPQCSQASQGVFWPLETNHDPMLLQAKASAGDLWLCRGDYDWDAYFVQTIHFFKWQRMTVRVKIKPAAAQRQRLASNRDQSLQ